MVALCTLLILDGSGALARFCGTFLWQGCCLVDVDVDVEDWDRGCLRRVGRWWVVVRQEVMLVGWLLCCDGYLLYPSIHLSINPSIYLSIRLSVNQ